MKIKHLPFHISDHRPILACFNWEERGPNLRRHDRLLRFEESWIPFEESKNIIQNSWREFSGQGAPIFGLTIEKCIKDLYGWNVRRLNGSISKAIEKSRRLVGCSMQMGVLRTL